MRSTDNLAASFPVQTAFGFRVEQLRSGTVGHTQIVGKRASLYCLDFVRARGIVVHHDFMWMAIRLGEWVAFQRRRHHGGMLTEERKQRLNAIGFVWNPQDRLWEQGLITLLNFKRREGHCCPSRYHVESNFKLGQWVSVQRYRKDLLKVERKRRLDAIGFIWDWKGNYLWEQNFAALLKFKRRRGHCRVPIFYSEGNLKLGVWVSTQRRNRLAMSAERRARLNKIEFMWRTPRSHTAYRPTKLRRGIESRA